MTRAELKEIIAKVIKKLKEKGASAPIPACLYGDAPCDVTTEYAVGEEG